MIDEDRLRPLQLPGDPEAGHFPLHIAVLGVELGGHPGAGGDHIGKPEKKILVPKAAPELAVGNALKPDFLLQTHDVAHGRVLYAAEFGVVDFAFPMRLPRLQQVLRTQQASDVVGAERGDGGFERHCRILVGFRLLSM